MKEMKVLMRLDKVIQVYVIIILLILLKTKKFKRNKNLLKQKIIKNKSLQQIKKKFRNFL